MCGAHCSTGFRAGRQGLGTVTETTEREYPYNFGPSSGRRWKPHDGSWVDWAAGHFLAAWVQMALRKSLHQQGGAVQWVRAEG